MKKLFSKYILTSLLVFPIISMAASQPTSSLEKRLDYLLPSFINAAKLTFDRNGLLTNDISKQLDLLKNTSTTTKVSLNARNPAVYSKKFTAQIHQTFKGLENIPIQDSIFYPRTTQEVQALINFAKLNHDQIRVIGAAHSPAPAIYNAENPHELRLILNGDLKKIDSIEPDASQEFAIVTVGAGCNLGVNPADPNSTLQNSFNYQIDEAGYALPTLGGISHQTIAGFLQTSSSGGTAQHNIADSLEALEWVDGNGLIHHAKKGEDEFNAAAVSMGLFGVITHATFKVPKKYLVEGTETNHELQDSFLAKDAENHYTKLHNALFTDNEYIHINWLPQKYVDRTMQWVGKSTTNISLPVTPYSHSLSSKFVSGLATIVFKVGNLIDEYGNDNDLLLRIKAEMFKLFCNPSDKQEFRDVWYKTLPIDDQADVDGDVETLFSEFWFPEDQLDNVMQRLEELFKENPQAAGNFIVELYCAKQSPFWLSPSYGYNIFRVDLYWWNRNIGEPNKYFGIFWNKLLDIPGARLHWGKYLPQPGKAYGTHAFTTTQLLTNYPKMSDWMKLREKMDPQQLFVTDYWRNILNIPMPAG
jgi:hypothetical protein